MRRSQHSKHFPPAKKKMLCPFCHKGRLVFVGNRPAADGSLLTVRVYNCPQCGNVLKSVNYQ